MTVLAADSGTVPTLAPGIQNGVPGTNAFWVTIELPPSAPLLLQPNTQYGFDIQALGTGNTGPFFMEWNGTSADAFDGGQAIETVRHVRERAECGMAIAYRRRGGRAFHSWFVILPSAPPGTIGTPRPGFRRRPPAAFASA